jgi:Holliday junction resolvase RusA-like endonuclease
LALAAGARDFAKALHEGAPLSVMLRVYPPDKRRRDWDNIVASLKSGLDGIADALGIDDAHFRLSIDMLPEVVTGGRVDVVVEAEGQRGYGACAPCDYLRMTAAL